MIWELEEENSCRLCPSPRVPTTALTAPGKQTARVMNTLRPWRRGTGTLFPIWPLFLHAKRYHSLSQAHIFVDCPFFHEPPAAGWESSEKRRDRRSTMGKLRAGEAPLLRTLARAHARTHVRTRTSAHAHKRARAHTHTRAHTRAHTHYLSLSLLHSKQHVRSIYTYVVIILFCYGLFTI